MRDQGGLTEEAELFVRKSEGKWDIVCPLKEVSNEHQ